MKTEKETKQELIEFIREKESTFTAIDYSDYSVTKLIVIKTCIEAKINYVKARKKE
jgi:hypothetical protein